MFEKLGYSIEYYSSGKYIGSLVLAIESTERPLGYAGRAYFKLNDDIMLKKGNKTVKVKKGTEVYTEMIQLCGKML